MLGLRLVFLVAEPVNGDTEDKEEVQERLIREAETVGDILQPSIEDGHRKLGYKILSGEWIDCPREFTVYYTFERTFLRICRVHNL